VNEREKPKLELRPHPKAPLFGEDRDDRYVVLAQAISEALSSNIQITGEIKEVLRQACLVSLFFYLRFVASYRGPYGDLTDHLHLEMCNFRQSDLCMAPGTRAGAFIFRGGFKSTIFTHGGDEWEMIRNPNIRILIANNRISKAEEFMRNIKNAFSTNDFVKALFPEYCWNVARPPRWNESELTLPNRTIDYTEPNVATIGVGGAAEGGHYDLFNPDDIVGLNDLNAERRATMDMVQKVNWFKTNSRALLDSWVTSRIMMCGTFYSIDDPNYIPIKKIKTLTGYQHPKFQVKRNGTWNIYYRKAREDGVITFPERFTEEGLNELREDDYWAYQTQMQNDPLESGVTEFSMLDTVDSVLMWDDERSEHAVLIDPNLDSDREWTKDEEEDESLRTYYLSMMNIGMYVDPAGTDTGISAKTSRTAIEIWGLTYDGWYILLWARVGYYGTYTMFDHIFEGHRKFLGHVKGTYIESNAMQKIIQPVIWREQELREQWINPRGIPAKGDKEARIRNALASPLQRGRVVLVQGQDAEFKEELAVFPQNKYKMDALDAAEKAFTDLSLPMTPDEEEEAEAYESEREAEVSAVTGYS
jgi:hypothetical protein